MLKLRREKVNGFSLLLSTLIEPYAYETSYDIILDVPFNDIMIVFRHHLNHLMS